MVQLYIGVVNLLQVNRTQAPRVYCTLWASFSATQSSKLWAADRAPDCENEA